MTTAQQLAAIAGHEIFSGVRFGLMNTVLDWIGIENVAWLADPNPPWYWLVIVTLRLWLQSGST